MPVFQDPQRRCNRGRPLEKSSESLGGGNSSSPSHLSTLALGAAETQPQDGSHNPNNLPVTETSCRQELIKSIKRGEHPTWIPIRSLDFDSTPDIRASSEMKEKEVHTGLLPAVQIKESRGDGQVPGLSNPNEIERPGSALHSGDFRDPSPDRSTGFRGQRPIEDQSNKGPLGLSPTTPWYIPTPAPSFRRLETDPAFEESARVRSAVRSRAPSLGSSLSSSFVYRAPTSPLVNSASNTDFDFSPHPMSSLPSSEKTNRRRTLPPESFQSMNTSSPELRSTSYRRPLPNLRREHSLPYQAHQPRRSMASNSFLDGSSPATPPRTSRHPSFSSEISPLQHASMVGSYEESILRGRMSTTPSKPLDFVAQIGVLGKGDCKPSLRCPAHVTVKFPAVFYSYSSTPGKPNLSDDSPSPYVGNIDLEHNLKPVPAKTSRRAQQGNQPSESTSRDITAPENTPIGLELDRRKREKHRRRSQSPKAPSGGCYRIPQQGQLQIVIKNPNKTAVKLFLVPYDLGGMEPGTKTFIRQRSYSAGPILDTPISSTGNTAPTGFEKSTLRYLIHLRICSPSRGRFYLYDNIRVVFANRVPDGKEKLRNEVQLPEPRYSIWKANKEPGSVGSAGAKLAADKAFRRRSSGFGFPMSFGFGDIDGLAGFDSPSNKIPRRQPAPTIPPLPTSYNISALQQASPNALAARPESRTQELMPLIDHSRPPSSRSTTPSQAPPPVSGFNIGSPVSSTHNSGLTSGSDSGESGAGSTNSGPYTKLRRQESHYGSSERFPQGLLTQRLKSLDVHRTTSNEDSETDASTTNADGDDHDASGDVEMSDA